VHAARPRGCAAGATAPPLDRQRLAQDLHDGVGSHLTSIISALDAGTPKERSTAALLQECLVELKLLVDGMDEDATVLSLLASLRYRIEPLLSAAHIRLHWAVADDEELERVTGDTARHVLHLTQEALANVLRHSGADQVSITCCISKAQQALLLEINDNGVGLHEPAGEAPGQRACGKACAACTRGRTSWAGNC
jgi:signal transduction histidine kinase